METMGKAWSCGLDHWGRGRDISYFRPDGHAKEKVICCIIFIPLRRCCAIISHRVKMYMIRIVVVIDDEGTMM